MATSSQIWSMKSIQKGSKHGAITKTEKDWRKQQVNLGWNLLDPQRKAKKILYSCLKGPILFLLEKST